MGVGNGVTGAFLMGSREQDEISTIKMIVKRIFRFIGETIPHMVKALAGQRVRAARDIVSSLEYPGY